MYLNKAMVYGNLTRDPEIKALPNGTNVTRFSLATNRTWNDKDGKKQEAVEYHNVASFGKQAEVMSKYLTKGSPVFVEGRLQTQSWEHDGVKHYRTEIVVEQFQFGPKKEAPGTQDSPSVMPDYGIEEVDPNDIPF